MPIHAFEPPHRRREFFKKTAVALADVILPWAYPNRWTGCRTSRYL